MKTVEEVLAHHGIKGMHWGVRRNRRASKSGPPSPDAARATAAKTKAKKSGTHSLSNKELQDLVTRMNLEQQYSRLSSTKKQKSAGAKFAQEILVNVAKQHATKLAADALSKAVAGAVK